MRGTWFYTLGMFGLAFVGAGIAAAQGDPPVKEGPAAESVEKAAGNADTLRETLDKRLDWNFEAVPLESVVRKLREQTGLTIVVPPTSLESAGLEADQPFSLKAKNMSLRAGLNHLLRDYGLAWGFDDGKLVIASSDEAADLLTTEKYSLTELLPKGVGRAERNKLVAEIISAVQRIVAPEKWEDAGGVGKVSAVGNRLAVKQDWRTHEQVSRFLARLKQARGLAESKESSVPPVPSWRIDEPENDVLERLPKQPADWPFEKIELPAFVTFLEDRYGITVRVSDDGLSNAGVERDVELNSRSAGLSVAEALSRLLASRNLSWLACDEAILITSREEVDFTVEYRVYPLADLAGGDEHSLKYDLEKWATLLVSHVGRDSWPDEPDTLPGPFATLLVPQTREAHGQITEFLAAIRKLRASVPRHLATIEPLELRAQRGGPVRAALDKEASFDFREVSLAAAAKAIAAKYTIPVLLDERSFEDYGIDKDEPLGEQALMMPLAKALDALLGPLDLYWCVRDGALVITADEQTRTRFYPVHDLVKAGDKAADDALAEAGDKLKADVESNAAPDSWGDAGGSGAASFFPQPAMLVVTQTETGHREVEAFLKKRRSAKE